MGKELMYTIYCIDNKGKVKNFGEFTQIEKPLTENMKEKANKLYGYLKEQKRYCTKAELMEFMGVANERTIRDIISTLATKAPIISTSDNKGYKLAICLSDLEECEHCWKEIDSRIAELEKRKIPLIKFREKCKNAIDKNENQ